MPGAQQLGGRGGCEGPDEGGGGFDVHMLAKEYGTEMFNTLMHLAERGEEEIKQSLNFFSTQTSSRGTYIISK